MSININENSDNSKVEIIDSILDQLKEQGISEKDVVEHIRKRPEGESKRNKKDKIPVSIFNQGLSPLQAIVKYLFEERLMKFSEISLLLNRDQRTIGNTYRAANIKLGRRLSLGKDRYHVDLDIFGNRNLSFLENLCIYLREHYVWSYHKIGIILGKDERTIWTAVNRAEKKLILKDGN